METNQATPVFDFTATLNAVLAQAIQIHTAPLVERIAELEVKVNNLQSTNADFIKEIADDAARMVFAEHTEEYDHDGYDRLEDKIEDKVSDAIDDYDFEDKVRDIMRHASVSIDI